VTRRLVILGTTVTVPDPASVTELAAGFRKQGGQLADLEETLQALNRPDAWGEWTGQAADTFGQSLGQLPGEVAEARDAYGDVAAVLQRYAAELEPVVNALSSLSFRAEDAEGNLQAVSTAHAQAKARGENTTLTGWDTRLADATAAVSSLRAQLNRLLAELTTLAATCAKQITAAEPRKPKQSLFGKLESDFVRDIAHPVGHAVKDIVHGAEAVAKLELTGALAMGEALFVNPVKNVGLHVIQAAEHFNAEQLGTALGDVAGVLGILALVPGLDVIAAPAALIVGGAAAAADWWAAAHNEDGASYLQAALATVGLGLGGVSMVAGKALDAEPGLQDLASGADADASGTALWKTGLPRVFHPSDVKAALSDLKENLTISSLKENLSISGIKENLLGGVSALKGSISDVKDAMSETYQQAKGPMNPKTGVLGAGQALSNSLRSHLSETFIGVDSHTPAEVKVAYVKWGADRANDLVTTVQDIQGQRTESQVR
jgi:uncharacterized protein YukE